MSSILLQGGTVLLHGQGDHVFAKTSTDILIKGNKIKEIGKDIQAPENAEVIDCTDKLISPGFVDTHHHVWQTQLKGRHANENLLEYMYSGNFTASSYNAEDTFWGQLGGCLELTNAGTTTVVDHAHINYTPSHSKNAITATTASGIRSIFCYCPTPRVLSWNPLTFNPDPLGDFVVDTFEELAAKSPFGNGRVTLGLAFDSWFLPKDKILDFFKKVDQYGIRTITSHAVRSTIMPSQPGITAIIDNYGLLDERFLFSHHTHMTAKEAELCREKGFGVSSTPCTELQMAHGPPVCFDDELGIQDRCSLGVDCHSNNAGDLVTQMRLGLQSARAFANEKLYKQDKEPRSAYKTVEQAYNLGTILGARAIHKQDSIGSIAVGKLADLAIFNTDSVAMVCAAQHDPVAAIVLHSSPADVDTVIVDGIIRKRGGKLVDVKLDEEGSKIAGKESLQWKDVARKLIEGRERIQRDIETHDVEDARKVTLGMFHVDGSKIVDKF